MRKIFNHIPIKGLPKLTASTGEHGKRVYITPDGKKYFSVTTLLGALSDKSINAWKKRVGEEEANRISKRATDLGTNIHKIAEDYIDNVTDYYGKAGIYEKMIFSAFQLSLDRINNVLCQEATLYSDLLQAAGRVDCIAEFDGKLSIIDFKTANKPKDEEDILGYFMQLTMYSLMFEEMTGIVIPNIVILMITTSGDRLVFKKNRKHYYKHVKELLDEHRRNYSNN